MPNCTAHGIELVLPVARIQSWTGGEPSGSSQCYHAHAQGLHADAPHAGATVSRRDLIPPVIQLGSVVSIAPASNSAEVTGAPPAVIDRSKAAII